VTFRTRLWLAAALGVCVARPLPGRAADPPQEPARLQAPASSNQAVADAVAARLRQGGRLHGYSVDVAVRGGTAELTGVVGDPAQRAEAVRLAEGVPGVERVVDRLGVRDGSLVRVQRQLPPPEPVSPAPGGPPAVTTGPVPPEAVPAYVAPPAAPYCLNPPKMPPYAWPTYAPYNNFSRVAYPEAYPYNAWPFIGPVYPFPKVPLGWRSVKLEWDDGYWYFSKTATKYDWWHMRFW
jgi:hypothetical protein